MQRWAILLLAYKYHIEFHSTAAHGNADALSILPLPPTTPVQPSETHMYHIHQIESLPVTSQAVQTATHYLPLWQPMQSGRMPKDNEVFEPCCPLPFSQNLCLMAVISELGSSPVELLASLPYLHRHHLSIPALELFCLENTPVAEGLDIDVIWKSRLKQQEETQGNLSHVYRRSNDSNRKSDFQLNVNTDYYSSSNDSNEDLDLTCQLGVNICSK